LRRPKKKQTKNTGEVSTSNNNTPSFKLVTKNSKNFTSLSSRQEERKKNGQQQRVIQRLEQTIQELQIKLDKQTRVANNLEVGQRSLLEISTKVQDQLLQESRMRVTDQKKYTTMISSLWLKLKLCQEQLQKKLNEVERSCQTRSLSRRRRVRGRK
jgi:hypothetical protein